MTTILNSTVVWVCPNCDARMSTEGVPAKPILHPCRGTRLLLVPMIREGTAAKVETVEREDYVGDELVQTDAEGRPVMNVTVTRDQGEDLVVFAPTARIDPEELRG